MTGPQTIEDWFSHIESLEGETLLKEANAANSLAFVKRLRDEEGYSSQDIGKIFRKYALSLKAHDFHVPGGGEGSYVSYASLIENKQQEGKTMTKKQASVREKLDPVYDLMNEFQGLPYINSSVVKTYETISRDPLEVEGKMNVYVDPFKGGVTRTFKAKLKRMVADLPGVYITDFQSPRQLKGAPRKNESNIDFYSRNPYVVKFRFDEKDTMPEEDLDKMASLTKRVASTWMRTRVAYTPRDYISDLETTLREEFGVSNAKEKGSSLEIKQSLRDFEQLMEKIKKHPEFKIDNRASRPEDHYYGFETEIEIGETPNNPQNHWSKPATVYHEAIYDDETNITWISAGW